MSGGPDASQEHGSQKELVEGAVTSRAGKREEQGAEDSQGEPVAKRPGGSPPTRRRQKEGQRGQNRPSQGPRHRIPGHIAHEETREVSGQEPPGASPDASLHQDAGTGVLEKAPERGRRR